MDIHGLLSHPERIELVAQPIVDVQRGLVVGYETLSRFELEPRVSPDRVFAYAAAHGLGVALETVVVRKALELSRRKPANCFLTLNVDPLHLLTDQLQQVLREPETLAGVVLELTEHRAVEDMKTLTGELEALRKRGAAIAVDDAGSGYSGLSQLLELRPQLVKLDRSLVTNLHEEPAKLALVQMLGELAGRLDAWLLAEGVETDAELSALRQLGVPLAQGYFLGRPRPPFSELLPAAATALSRPLSRAERDFAVENLVEPCASLPADAEAETTLSLAVFTSSDDRPVGLHHVVDGTSYRRAEHQLLKVKVESSLAVVARRAATRAERYRWDPIICIDDRGCFCGVVRMHRLLTWLAEHAVIPRNASLLPPGAAHLARPALAPGK